MDEKQKNFNVRNGLILDLFESQLKANAEIQAKLELAAERMKESAEVQKELCRTQNEMIQEFKHIPRDVNEMKKIVNWIKWGLLPLTASLVGIIFLLIKILI